MTTEIITDQQYASAALKSAAEAINQTLDLIVSHEDAFEESTLEPRLLIGVGSHEPIFHRLRTGNSTAEEWARCERETSIENLDLLERLGITRAHIACTKGFGLEYE